MLILTIALGVLAAVLILGFIIHAPPRQSRADREHVAALQRAYDETQKKP